MPWACSGVIRTYRIEERGRNSLLDDGRIFVLLSGLITKSIPRSHSLVEPILRMDYSPAAEAATIEFYYHGTEHLRKVSAGTPLCATTPSPEAGRTDENQALVEGICTKNWQPPSPQGMTYTTLRLADGTSSHRARSWKPTLSSQQVAAFSRGTWDIPG